MAMIPLGRCCTAGPAGSLGMAPGRRWSAVEPVIGDQKYGGIRPGELQQTLQHHVVKRVSTVHHAAIEIEKTVDGLGKWSETLTPADGLRGMVGEPANDVGVEAFLGEDVPDGFDLA